MSEEEEVNPGQMADEGVTAILGLVLVHSGGEVRVPRETVEAGLPENSGVQVFFDAEAEELVVKVADRGQ